MEYLIHISILICIYIILALPLQLSVGFGGLLNFGFIGFFALGAYITALLTLIGSPFLLSLIIACLVTAFFGLILSIPLKNLDGDYFALATIAFTLVIYSIALNWRSLTHGPLGLVGITRPEFFSFKLTDNFLFLILSIVLAGSCYLLIKKVILSPFGKLLQAIRDDEIAAKALAHNTLLVKISTTALGAFMAGLAGSLYAVYIGYIDPSTFGLLQIIPILTIVIIGGLASLEGTLLAVILLTVAPEALRFVGLPSSMIGPLRQILFALVLLLILIYRPKGLFGKVTPE